ncbi:MAG TPA: zf-HC2 domain-containing protein [Vicinamibacterales bacterium]|nr:zf-HC2 domain-containing protein [Vicinamibacterales bacterium]
MTAAPGCGRLALADLADYAAGVLSDSEAAAVEEHLFLCSECGARAAEVDALLRGLRAAARAADLDGVVTDAVLNQLARDGVRIRTYALTPGAVVPCAVWEDDELMVLRLRGDFAGAREVTIAQRIAGAEVNRATVHLAASPQGELIFAQPATLIRRLPAGEVEILLSASDGGQERVLGRYRLAHGGSLRR